MDNKVEQLKHVVLEAMPELGGIEGIKDAQEEVKEDIAKIKEESTATRDKIDKLLDAPFVKQNLAVPGSSGKQEFIYKNYNLNAITNTMRPEIADNRVWKMIDEAKKQEIAKMLIDVIEQGLAGKREIVVNTTMSEGTAGSGGYLVFDEFMNVIRSLGQLYGVCLNEAEVVTMNSDVLHYPVDSDAAVTTAFKTETSDFADGIPADIVAEVQLTAKRL